MNKKIDVYVNGVYEFSTNKFPTCNACLAEIRAAKHLEIASVPKTRYMTIYDYDKVTARYATNPAR